jgi:hypothetical protein
MNRPNPPAQELMTPQEAARWFRRSVSWLRQQADLLRLGAHGSQPLYHVDVCRAFVLGQMRGADRQELRKTQMEALAATCRLRASAGAAAREPDPDALEIAT